MKAHLQYNWWKYLAVIIIPIVLWTSVFSSMAKPKDNERLSILFVGDGLDCRVLQENMVATIPQLTNQKIKSVKVASRVFDKDLYRKMLVSQCFDYDIIIISNSYYNEDVCKSVFRPFSEILIEQFDTASFLLEKYGGNNLPMGIVLFDKASNNKFVEYYSGGEACYMFFSPYSVNFSGLNGFGEIADDVALRVAQYLLCEQ